MNAAPNRLLSLSTIYPSAANPQFGIFVARVMEALAARDDWEVTLVNPVGSPPVALGRYRARVEAAVSGIEGGVAVLRPLFPLLPGIGARFNARTIARRILPEVRRLHGERPFALVDAQYFYPDGPAAQIIARELGLPLTITARGSDIHYWTTVPSARRAILKAADAATRIIAVSAAMAADLVALGMDPAKIAVVETGLDRARFHPIERAAARRLIAERLGLELPPEGPLLASVGALVPVKGQALAIAALAELPEAHLVLVGDGPEAAHLAQAAAEKGVGDRVHFTGRLSHEELPLLLSAADAMVLPSEREGLANAWVEALACGTPLVIPDVGGARQVVSAPEAGELVARKPAAIAEGIRRVLARAWPQTSVASTVGRFDWTQSAADLAAVYAGIL